MTKPTYTTSCAQSQGPRDEQEDRVAVRLSPVLLAVLCDGMGGHDMGAQAAEAALKSTLSTAPSQVTVQVVQAACARVRALSTARSHAPGTTLIYAKQVTLDVFQIVHVGDSRAYRIRAGGAALERLTKDHNLAQVRNDEAAENGRPATREGSHILLASIPDAERVGDCRVSLRPGDSLLLASDGFYDAMEDEPGPALELLGGRSWRADPAAVLVRLYEGRYQDNASVVLLRRGR